MSVARKQEFGGSSNYISQLWQKYFPYWPVFLILLILCIAGAWLKMRYVVPQYAATAKIYIKDKKAANESTVLESLDQVSPKKTIENEIEVLRSKSLMSEVVKNLHLYSLIFEEGKFVSRSAYNSSPVNIIAQNPDSLGFVEKIYFSFDKKNSQVVLNGARYPLDAWVKTKYGVLKFVPNNLDYNSENPLYFNLIHPEFVAGSFINSLGISTFNKASSILLLRLEDEVPDRAAKILNELLNVYVQNSSDEKSSLAANTLQYVESRLKLVSHDLDSIEKKIQNFKSSKGVVDINAQGQQYLTTVGQNDQKIAELNNQLSVLNQVEQYVVSKNNKDGIVPSTLGVDDPTLSQLLNKLYDTELEYQKKKVTVGENHPIATTISDQIQKIRPNILENIQSQRKNLMATRNNLYSANGAYSSMLRSIPQTERQLIDINREHAIKSDLYNFLLQKREEAALSFGSLVEDARIMDKAEASYSALNSSNKKYYIMAIVIALALGVALVSGNEMFNRTILYRHEIESFTSWPVIGEISFEKSNDIIKVDENKNSFIAAQFRKLRTSLRFLGVNSKRKKILVTSTISGEGKSFVAANLGYSLALTGKKVVMLEFDLSNPTLSDKLEVKEDVGLTDYLEGDKEPDEIIVRTTINENLFIIPSGPLPDKPSELIVSTASKTEDLLSYLEENFDYIIIDTAPVGPMTDAYTLSSFCDATLYVIRHKYTPKVFVQRIDEENKINQLKNPAIIFNAVRSRGFSKNGYGYGYGYGYDYGYGYENKQRRRVKNNVVEG